MQGHSDTQSGAADQNQVSRLEAVLHQMQRYAEQASRSLASGSVLTIEKAPEVLGRQLDVAPMLSFLGLEGCGFRLEPIPLPVSAFGAAQQLFTEPEWPVLQR